MTVRKGRCDVPYDDESETGAPTYVFEETYD
jgi:hypothetical protein